MAIQGVTNNAGLFGVNDTRETTSSTLNATSKLGRDEFMKLLLVQMQNQNPLEPVGDTEFVSQLSQFSVLDSMTKLNNSFQDLLLIQSLTQGANLIGKTIKYEAGDPPKVQQGKVESVEVKDGKIELLVNGAKVNLNQVRGIAT